MWSNPQIEPGHALAAADSRPLAGSGHGQWMGLQLRREGLTILLRVEYQPQRLSACRGCSLCSTSRALGGVVGAGEGRTAARLVSSVATHRNSKHRNAQRCCTFDIDASEDTWVEDL